MVELYLHSTIRLHDLMPNELSTGITLPNLYKVSDIQSGDYLNMFVLIVTSCIPVIEYQRFQETYGLHLQVDDEIRGTFLRDIGIQLQEYTVSQPRRPPSALCEFVCFTSQIT
jgi:hypothetical protein